MHVLSLFFLHVLSQVSAPGSKAAALLLAPGNPASCKVVRRQFDFYSVTRQNTNVVHSDLAGDVSEYLEVVIKLHEDPYIPNYGKPGKGAKIERGMTLAIEPMIALGTYEVRVLGNDWTVVMADGKKSAHYENTILVTDGEPEILTLQ